MVSLEYMQAARRCAQALLFSCLLAGAADAQVATGKGAGGVGAGPIVEITVKGNVVSSLSLSITGSIDTFNNVTATITGSGTSGVVNYGVYNLAGGLLT